MASTRIVVADAILTRWWEEDAARLFSGVETGEVARGGPRGPRGPLLLDCFRLVAVAMITMAVVTTTIMAVGTEGKDNNQLKVAVKAMVATATATAMATETKIN